MKTGWLMISLFFAPSFLHSTTIYFTKHDLSLFALQEQKAKVSSQMMQKDRLHPCPSWILLDRDGRGMIRLFKLFALKLFLLFIFFHPPHHLAHGSGPDGQGVVDDFKVKWGFPPEDKGFRVNRLIQTVADISVTTFGSLTKVNVVARSRCISYRFELSYDQMSGWGEDVWNWSDWRLWERQKEELHSGSPLHCQPVI